MKGITKASRLNTALQVVERMNKGLNVSEACKEVGLPRSSFYYIINREEDTILAIQEMVEESNRQQLALLLRNKMPILEKVIEDALAERTKPRERLAIYKALSAMTERLVEAIRADSHNDKYARELLKGPILEPGKSTMDRYRDMTGEDVIYYGNVTQIDREV